MNFFRTTDTTDATDATMWKPGLKLYLSYEFFSCDRHDRYDRYNDMETRLKNEETSRQSVGGNLLVMWGDYSCSECYGLFEPCMYIKEDSYS